MSNLPLQPPGFNAARMLALMRRAVARCDLDLTGMTIVTEAATGAYICTPILAALAGADVRAIAMDTRYGSALDVARATLDLAGLAGVADRIAIRQNRVQSVFDGASVVTNSGHVRPIDRQVVNWLPSDAVVSLMYEAWEFRPQDIDLDSCIAKGISVGATNERHALVDVFSFLGPMSVKILHDAGVAVYSSNVLVICDNPFNSFVIRGLRAMGAKVDLAPTLESVAAFASQVAYDAVVIAMRPQIWPPIGSAGSPLTAAAIRELWPGAVVVQVLGDIDRASLSAAHVEFWPTSAPAHGHMGILLSAIGPEAIVNLQTGGLKVGQVLANGYENATDEDRLYVQFIEQSL